MPPRKKPQKDSTSLASRGKPNRAQTGSKPSSSTTGQKGQQQQNQKQQTKKTAPLKSRANRQRQHRLALGGNSRSQKTLTQIDFVKQQQALLAANDAEEELGYIDGEAGADDEAGDEDEDFELTARPSKKRRTSVVGKGVSRKRGPGGGNGRKKVDGEGSDDEDDDTTLTQMGYVTRPGGQEYTGKMGRSRTGMDRKRRPFQMETIGEEPEEEKTGDAVQQFDTDTGEGVGGRGKKRNTSEVEPETRAFKSEPPSSRDGIPRGPTTPRKQIRLVVPSSQSPDSPGLFLYPDTPPRFPLAPLSRNVTPKRARSHLVKSEHRSPLRGSRAAPYEIPGSSFDSVVTGSPARSCAVESLKGHKTTPATSPPLETEQDSEKTVSTLSHLPFQARDHNQEMEAEAPNRSANERKNSKDRVIYETGGESEEEVFHDTTSHISDDDNDSWRTQSQHYHQAKSQKYDNNLDGFPSQRHNPDFIQETYNDLPGTTLGSEPSMLYYREPMSLAFDPGSELDNIDSERLAELFPNPNLANQEPTAGPLSTIQEEQEEEDTAADDGPAQTLAKDATDLPEETEVVPDSPPRQRAHATKEQNIPPPSSPPVVLVASSQQSDEGSPEPLVVPSQQSNKGGFELDRDHRIESQSSRHGFVTTSQLLTDSLMESVPGPPLWMSSQCLTQEEQEGATQE
ncbi:hypothetical protein AJ79_08598 [Helicocarpus griseus UAMH5409]|uniref:Uncharacterized protein n=1 Tax=Helicocarpus griseus UAMH5409 TaxID=1447875 RepID=A0A2B7WS05_9EURO|nr:hypothetical protein AJ79_08598 [Helicocarpus griseus UAMH5409]